MRGDTQSVCLSYELLIEDLSYYLLTYQLPVVPASMIHPLAQKLDGWLGTVRLQHRHVQIVDKEDEMLSHWRTENVFPPVTHNHNGYNLDNV